MVERSYANLIAPGLIDTTLKLQLILLFYRHPRWDGAVARLSEWLCENPWAVQEAVDGLVEAGLLGQAAMRGATPHYRLEPNGDYRLALEQLVRCFDDRLRRDEIYTLVRSADQERLFRTLTKDSVPPAFLPAW